VRNNQTGLVGVLCHIKANVCFWAQIKGQLWCDGGRDQLIKHSGMIATTSGKSNLTDWYHRTVLLALEHEEALLQSERNSIHEKIISFIKIDQHRVLIVYYA
jgi:hypothetical protein